MSVFIIVTSGWKAIQVCTPDLIYPVSALKHALIICTCTFRLCEDIAMCKMVLSTTNTVLLSSNVYRTVKMSIRWLCIWPLKLCAICWDWGVMEEGSFDDKQCMSKDLLQKKTCDIVMQHYKHPMLSVWITLDMGYCQRWNHYPVVMHIHLCLWPK